MVSSVTIWRHERKAKAEALGVSVGDLPDMREEITNKSNFYSEKHHNFLYHAAWRIVKKFKRLDLDVEELVDVGWYECARYHEDVTREYKRIFIKMYAFAMSRYKGVSFYSVNVPKFVDKADEVMEFLPFRTNERLSIHDDTEDRAAEIYALCYFDERKLLDMRFRQGLTYKEIGKICNKSFSNMIIKYQSPMKRI